MLMNTSSVPRYRNPLAAAPLLVRLIGLWLERCLKRQDLRSWINACSTMWESPAPSGTTNWAGHFGGSRGISVLLRAAVSIVFGRALVLDWFVPCRLSRSDNGEMGRSVDCGMQQRRLDFR